MASGKSRASPDIRFSDVAHYVGLSLMKDPQSRGGGATKSSVRLNPLKSQESVQRSQSSLDGGMSREETQKVEKLKTQLEWLRAEQKAEKEQLRRMEGSLSDSMLLEKKAQRRTAHQREQRNYHQRHASELDKKMQLLQQEIKQSVKTRALLDPVNMSPPRGFCCQDCGELKAVLFRDVRDGESYCQKCWEEFYGKPPPESATVQAVQAAARPSELPEDAPRGHVAHAAVRSGSGTGPLPPVTTADGPRHGSLPSAALAAEQDYDYDAAFASTPQKPAKIEDDQPMRKAAPAAPVASSQEEEPDVAGDENMTLKEYFDAADMRDREKEMRSTWHSQGGGSQKDSIHEKKSTSKRSMNMSSINFHRPPQLSDEEIVANHDLYREIIRRDLIDKAGSAKDAFRKMDLNGSGNISLQEFADGVKRMGINWEEITQMRRPRELFKIFDLDKDGVITFPELFPDTVDKEPERVSTPDFWNRWVKKNRDLEHGLRDPAWQPKDPDAELALLFSTSESHEQAGVQRKWMAATIRRLKNRGKSDARCREIVAGHLPRGTGPKDREDVQTFSAQEVKMCRKTYNDQVNDPVRNIQKVVYDMREQRRVLHDFKQKLWTVTMEPVMRKQLDDDRKTAAAVVGLGGITGLTGPLTAKVASDPGGASKRSLKSIAQECNMDDESLEDLCRDFLNCAEKSNEMLGKKGYSKLLQQICPNRTISESDADYWWDQILKAMPRPEEGQGRDRCDFERFAIWYSTSEARR